MSPYPGSPTAFQLVRGSIQRGFNVLTGFHTQDSTSCNEKIVAYFLELKMPPGLFRWSKSEKAYWLATLIWCLRSARWLYAYCYGFSATFPGASEVVCAAHLAA